jgi:hypothetical protein
MFCIDQKYIKSTTFANLNINVKNRPVFFDIHDHTSTLLSNRLLLINQSYENLHVKVIILNCFYFH